MSGIPSYCQGPLGNPVRGAAFSWAQRQACFKAGLDQSKKIIPDRYVSGSWADHLPHGVSFYVTAGILILVTLFLVRRRSARRG